jgi:UDP-2,3-diacylglucosamine hydrolase
MKVLFIADAHLKGLDDPCQRSLCTFLDGLGNVDKLVILGDLFEFWTGFNDVVYYHYLPVLTRLLTLKEKGTEIIYMEGNHDFFMGPFFTEVLGAEVHSEPIELVLEGKRFYLGHGDTVDRNLKYAFWRALSRSFIFRALYRVLPPSVIWKIAGFLSAKSRIYHERAISIEALQREFARERIREGLDGVMLAHTHVARLVEEDASGRKGFYLNPGSWMDESTYIVYEDGKFSLERYGRQE